MPKIQTVTRAMLATIIILAIILAVLVFFLARQYLILRHEQILNTREIQIGNIFKSHGAPTPDDVVFVRPWMTFDYVNKLFAVPPAYLQMVLHISDPKYPRVTISSYAREIGTDQSAFLGDVNQALRAYLLSSASSSASASVPTSTGAKNK